MSFRLPATFPAFPLCEPVLSLCAQCSVLLPMLTPQCSDPGTLSISSTNQRFRGTLGLSCLSAHLTLASFRRLDSSTLLTWKKAPTMLKLPICGQDTVLAA